MNKLFIPILIGTTREQRKSVHAAELMLEVGKTFDDIVVELVDPKDFNFQGDGNDPEGKDPRYSDITLRADAFLIVTPEYNHSFPGSLKRMLDSELKNYVHKPVAFVGASSGQWGGVRAIEALVSTVREMGLVSTFSDLQFPRVQDVFNDQGVLQDEKYRHYAAGVYEELIWMTRTLQWGRQNLPSKHHSISAPLAVGVQ